MLSIFPELLFLAPFSALVIRLAVSVVFAYSAWVRIPRENFTLRTFGIVDAGVAILLFAGAYTQLAALVATVCALVWIFVPWLRPLPQSTSLLVFVLSVSLIVTGPGPFAFDLPL